MAAKSKARENVSAAVRETDDETELETLRKERDRYRNKCRGLASANTRYKLERDRTCDEWEEIRLALIQKANEIQKQADIAVRNAKAETERERKRADSAVSASVAEIERERKRLDTAYAPMKEMYGKMRQAITNAGKVLGLDHDGSDPNAIVEQAKQIVQARNKYARENAELKNQIKDKLDWPSAYEIGRMLGRAADQCQPPQLIARARQLNEERNNLAEENENLKTRLAETIKAGVASDSTVQLEIVVESETAIRIRPVKPK